mgnify:CR=1 FL=1
MKKVFISHSTKNAEFVKFLADVLEKHGFECWYCEKHITDLENFAGKIRQILPECAYCIVVLSADSIASGHVLNEIYLASQFNIPKIPIRLAKIPLTEEISYHLPLNAIDYFRMTDEDFFRLLFDKMQYHPDKIDFLEKEKQTNHRLSEVMRSHTSEVFLSVENAGGYAWGENKSLIQNCEGGWLTENVIIEEVDEEPFVFPAAYEEAYTAYYESPAFQKMLLRGQNQVRWMLTGFGAYQNKLFLSVKRTEWSQTMFSWHTIMADAETKKQAIDRIFLDEDTDYPNSLCLHAVLVDSENSVVATRIKRRKKNDYPATVAVTLGEQLNASDFSAGLKENFVLQWLKRAVFEEFGFDSDNYFKYINEGSVRVMSLDAEGDIFNFSLVCCAKLNCTCAELSEYYRLHRSADDEFDEVFPISPAEIPHILAHSQESADAYHPSSFLRLLFAYVYITGTLPDVP